MNKDIFLKEIYPAMNDIYKTLHENKMFCEAKCDGCGECCDFNSSGHQLYLSLLEALYMLEVAELPGCGENFTRPLLEGKCPYQQENTCLNRGGRAIGCRVYYCSLNLDEMQDLSNLTISKVKQLSQLYNLPWIYGELSIMLPAAKKLIDRMKTDEVSWDKLDEEMDALFD